MKISIENKVFLWTLFAGVIVITIAVFQPAHANANPCEYIDQRIRGMQSQMDTGDDPNFTRIVQQKNQDIIIACQDYEIARLREAKNSF
jgi:hypothetical protein